MWEGCLDMKGVTVIARASLVLLAVLIAIALAGCPNENEPMPTTTESESALVGEWQGINGTSGLLTINSDHTYTYSSGGGGDWQATSEGAVFYGTLSAWNGGQATIDRYGTLEFHWQSSSGINYFVFEKLGE